MKHISEIIPEAIGHIRPPLRHGSLFSGIGGFDLAAEWMGWENVFHCEWNPFGQKVLNYYWPKAETFTDITKSNFKKFNGTIDIISGGFPCQPYSVAGKRKGKEDERHLWPEMLRTIREVQPRWIVGENVPGLANWERGMVLKEIKTDLENEGFEVFPPVIIPACAKNAPHRRDRIWIIANAIGNGHGRQSRLRENTGTQGKDKSEENKRERVWDGIEGNGKAGNVADTECIRQQRQRRTERRECKEAYGNWKASWADTNGGWPTQSPVRIGNDGLPAGMDTTTFSKSKWNEESLKAAGNAIVPQVAHEIFKAIEAYEMLPKEQNFERSVATMPNR